MCRQLNGHDNLINRVLAHINAFDTVDGVIDTADYPLSHYYCHFSHLSYLLLSVLMLYLMIYLS